MRTATYGLADIGVYGRGRKLGLPRDGWDVRPRPQGVGARPSAIATVDRRSWAAEKPTAHPTA